MGQNLPRMTLLLGPGPGGLTRAASVGLGYAYATRAVDGTDSHLCSVLGLECSAAAIIQAGLKCVMGSRMPSLPEEFFSFLYFLKIKISKIYVRFQIFQKYTPVALP